MGRRADTPRWCGHYDEARPADIVRLDKRRTRRFEQSDLAADLADEFSTEPFLDRTDDTDFDHDLLARFDWEQDEWDRIDADEMAYRADEAARLRAERIADLDIDAICGWGADTTLVWSDWTDNSAYDQEV